MRGQTRGSREGYGLRRHLLLLCIVLVFIGAFLMAQSFKWSQFSWLAWIGLFPLLLAIRTFSPFQAMLAGAVWGVSIFAISRFVHASNPAMPQTVTAFALLAIVPALYAYVAGVLTRLRGFPPLILALGWIGVELTLKPLDIANGFMTHAADGLTLAQITSGVLGYAFVGFFVVFAAALVLEIASSLQFQAVACRLCSVKPKTGFLSFTQQSHGHFPAIILRPSKPRAPPCLVS